MTQSIVATIRVKEGRQDQFEDVALKLVEAVNANEEGCLLYTLNKGDDPAVYVFLERYADAAAMSAHRGSDHFKSLGRLLGEFMDGPPEVTLLSEVG